MGVRQGGRALRTISKAGHHRGEPNTGIRWPAGSVRSLLPPSSAAPSERFPPSPAPTRVACSACAAAAACPCAWRLSSSSARSCAPDPGRSPREAPHFCPRRSFPPEPSGTGLAADTLRFPSQRGGRRWSRARGKRVTPQVRPTQSPPTSRSKAIPFTSCAREKAKTRSDPGDLRSSLSCAAVTGCLSLSY